MGSLWFWGVVLMGLVNGWYSSACQEEERIALLEINANSLQSNKKSNCCEWEGVKCSNITMKVIELTVPKTRWTHSYFNASMFLPFKDLVALHLPHNNFVGWFKNEGFDKLSKLRNLEFLDLSDNAFNRSVLSSLSQLSSLKSLYVRSNNLLNSSAANPSPERLSSLTNLEVLDISSNHCYDTDVLSVLNLKDFTRLKHLDVRDNYFHTIGSNNYDLCGLKNLQELILSSNNFDGILPSCLGNLTSLRHLDISDNSFTGNIAFSPLSKLTSLEHLFISENRFEIPISFKAFANHSSLVWVNVDENIGVQEAEGHAWVPKFQLEAFSMSNCSHVQTLPRFLHYQNKLRFLDLSYNHFGGNFPNWLLENNTLEGLRLVRNDFTGSFNMPSHSQPSFKYLSIPGNKITGQLHTNISSVFPNLVVLKMNTNCLEGHIPSSIWGMKHLEALELSDNQLLGELPTQLVNSSLIYLGLSHNKLQGKIFAESIPPFLVSLHLNGNKFISEIPKTISSVKLEMLEISNNRLSGAIPHWMGQLSGLLLFSVSLNQLQGSIPSELCNLSNLMFLDLSDNHFSGSIPTCFNQLESLQYLSISNNLLSGNLTHVLPKNSGLRTLDLSGNNISGSIPQRIGNLSALNILLLKSNQFEGEIPKHLCRLPVLRMLDLSDNKLTGSIPYCLSNISPEVTFWEYEFSFKLSQIGQKFFPGKFIVSIWVRLRIEFTTKSSSLTYGGSTLQYMSGMDLSSNELSGEIPSELGSLNEIQVLNISHNNLTGEIPKTFSNLNEIECIDLSYNKLSGRIPDELLQLHSLAVFRVAHNNLSGAIPEPKGQFSTFDESSFEGNPHLCGQQMHINCNSNQLEHPNSGNEEEEEDGFIDLETFYISFSVAYTIFFLGVIITLCINHHWRSRLFRLVDYFAFSCYYFLVDRLTVFRRL